MIITNTAVMASQSYPSNPGWQVASDYLNVGFCFYFVLELLIKLMGVGFQAFIRDRMNQFDGLVVVASLIEGTIFLLPGDETSEHCWQLLCRPGAHQTVAPCALPSTAATCLLRPGGSPASGAGCK